MRQIYVVRAKNAPSCFYRANSADDAVAKFKEGLKNSAEFADAEAQPLTMELLDLLAPDEFQLYPNTDF